jgi:hypothetical protein
MKPSVISTLRKTRSTHFTQTDVRFALHGRQHEVRSSILPPAAQSGETKHGKRLADLLFDAGEVLEMLRAENAMRLQWVGPHIQRVYDEVNDVMKELCD